MSNSTNVLATFVIAASAASVWITWRNHRQSTKALAWQREKAQLDLMGVADQADRYAQNGVDQPGTQAVRTLYPGFDFSMGGRYSDSRPLLDTDNAIYAPWDDEQLASLAEFQDSGTAHPYTCGQNSRHGNLLPEPNGWKCPVCLYTQRWAARSIVDGSWRDARDRVTEALRAVQPVKRRRHVWGTFARRRAGLFRSTTPSPGRTADDQ